MSTATELLIEQTQRADAGGAVSAGTPSPEQSESKAPNGGWFEGVADAELREFIRNKGWNDPAEMAVGYRNLEKLIGGEKVPLPKGDADAEGWERVYKALGRPATPEDYKLGDLESAAQYHKLGLTARQASGLSAWQDSLKAAQEQRAIEDAGVERARQLAAVRKEWGGDFDENLRLGKRAVREFGLEGSVEKLEAALGSSELLKLTARLGRGLKEDTFAGGAGSRSFGKTKEEAEEELALLRQDQSFVAKYLSKDTDAVKRFTELHRIAFE
jgi:hypothetical protein